MSQINRPTALEVIDLLNLSPLVGEGGFYRQTYFLGDSQEPDSTAIYYLITPDSFSSLHRLEYDEVFHFHAGDSCQMVQINEAGTLTEHILGIDLIRGERPQVIVPAQSWQGTRLHAGGTWALLGTTMTPGFVPWIYEAGTIDTFRFSSSQIQSRLAEFLAR